MPADLLPLRNRFTIPRWLWVTAALVFFAATVLFAYLGWRYFTLVPTIVNEVTDQLVQATGLSRFLVKGIVLLVTIPFFIAVYKTLRLSTVLLFHGHTARLAMYKSVWGVVIVVYIAAFSIAMYFATRNAIYKKNCVETPEGLKAYDEVKQDPIYGLPTHPCTLDESIELRNAPSPQLVTISDAHHFQFFDPRTGKPRVWYYKRADGGYELFDRPGADPGTGEALRAIDPSTRDEIVRQQDRTREEESAHQRLAAEESREQAAAEFIDASIHSQPGKRTVAVAILSQGSAPAGDAESQMTASLSSQGLNPVQQFFRPAFTSSGRAQRLLEGDWSSAEGLDLPRHVDLIVLGSVHTSFSTSPDLDNIISAHTDIELSCLRTASQASCGKSVIHSSGAGFNEAVALQNSIERARDQFDSFSRSIESR